MHEVILSVGIDIGTSTTQLIFSRLTLENRASSYMAPRIAIVDKQVIYRSKIYFTPLRSATEIDAESVKKIVRAEYSAAGMTPADIRTGAVIITGETARKRNANEVLAALSDLAGDFVVATAGRIWNPFWPRAARARTRSPNSTAPSWRIWTLAAGPATSRSMKRARCAACAVLTSAGG